MLIDKETLPLVAMDFMNNVHKEDVDILNELFELILNYESNATDTLKDNVNEKYLAWIEHTLSHFKGEEIEMQEKSFPAYPFHKNEHDTTLEKMLNTFEKWKELDDISILKKYIKEDQLPWLLHHIQSMDTVTAMFLKTGLSPCSMR